VKQVPKENVVHWFRQDLRLSDNPALSAAIKAGSLIPIFIWDEDDKDTHALGAASRVWLHHSLHALNQSLSGKLRVFQGDAKTVLQQLCDEAGVQKVYWNRCYEPHAIARDSAIKQALSSSGIQNTSFNGSLLWEPWEITKADGLPYKIFTPFYRMAHLKGPRRHTLNLLAPSFSNAPPSRQAVDIDALALLPKLKWHETLFQHWQAGESAALQALETFAQGGVDTYSISRDFPAQNTTSRLSPHLHWGEISPQQAWERLQFEGDNENIEHFKRELAWREFSYYLIYHNPDIPSKNLKPRFDRFPWRQQTAQLKSWQCGQTGYPIIDAGMRELWQTGHMHNRVRMLVASFLVKNLMIDWRDGAAWFWDCLLDADLASNSASWQWVAGCGSDAAPYFRIFNPVTQGEKFDANGHYTRRFIPELERLPDRYLFRPWEAPTEVLTQAGVCLGDNYPRPMIDLKQSRGEALEAFKRLD